MTKTKVLLLTIHYPLAMATYYMRALRARDDVELKTTGPYTGSRIPWAGGMNLPEKYAIPPDIPLPYGPNVGRVPYALVKAKLGDWIPDIVITVDAGICWVERPSDGAVVHVATDGHVLNYDHQRSISDYFFNMHPNYAKNGDLPLPYAYDEFAMYKDGTAVKDVHAVTIGIPYAQRDAWVKRLRELGVSVLYEHGAILDEYREQNLRAHIGLNWASKKDMNCRVFEIMAMGLCPVMSRCPDFDMYFVEGEHYLGFDTLEEAVEKVLWAKNNPEKAQEIADKAHALVTSGGFTFSDRVQTILDTVGAK